MKLRMGRAVSLLSVSLSGALLLSVASTPKAFAQSQEVYACIGRYGHVTMVSKPKCPSKKAVLYSFAGVGGPGQVGPMGPAGPQGPAGPGFLIANAGIASKRAKPRRDFPRCLRGLLEGIREAKNEPSPRRFYLDGTGERSAFVATAARSHYPRDSRGVQPARRWLSRTRCG